MRVMLRSAVMIAAFFATVGVAPAWVESVEFPWNAPGAASSRRRICPAAFVTRFRPRRNTCAEPNHRILDQVIRQHRQHDQR